MLNIIVSALLFPRLAMPQAAANTSQACAQMPYRNQNQIDYRISVSGVQGVALDPDGVPAPGVCVGLFSEPDHVLILSVQSDDEGRFKFRHFRSGTYRLVAEVDGLGVANATIHAGWFGWRHFVARMIPRGIDSTSYFQRSAGRLKKSFR